MPKKTDENAFKSSTDEDIDSELAKGSKTRSVTLPKKLNAQVVAICRVYGYSSVSEFIRQGTRLLVGEFIDRSARETIWDVVGGPMMEKVTKKLDEKTQLLQSSILELQKEFATLIADSKDGVSLANQEESNFPSETQY